MKYIYLHGFASSPSSSKAQYFVRQFHDRGLALEVPALDGGDFENLTITRQLAILTQLAAGEPAVVIGSSMGGYLAALYASLHPEVSKLVLLAPAFYFPQRWPQTMGVEKAEQWKRSGTMSVFHYGNAQHRSIGYGLITDASSYPAEPGFTQPGLIFHGRFDDVVPAAYSEEFALSHPNVRLLLLDSDHQLTDQADVLWNESSRFLFD